MLIKMMITFGGFHCQDDLFPVGCTASKHFDEACLIKIGISLSTTVSDRYNADADIERSPCSSLVQ